MKEYERENVLIFFTKERNDSTIMKYPNKKITLLL